MRLRRDIKRLMRESRRNDSPRFWGYVQPPGADVGALGDWLASGINQNLTAWRSAPGATIVELQVIDWILRMVGMPRGTVGLFTSGGSLANLAGLAAAREAAVPYDMARRGLQRRRGERLVLYASEAAHHSIQKGAAILGIGSDQVRLVPTDRRLRLDLAALRRLLRSDRRKGYRPFCVVATAGTVTCGAVDPLREIAAVCRSERLWMHVDACYGGFAVLAPTGRPLLRGLERADSIALDPHKWLYAPHDAGCILYRRGGAARRAFRFGADYARLFGGTGLQRFAFWDFGPELSRRFRALKVWLILKYHGTVALSRLIEEDLQLARLLEERIREEPRLELLSPAQLSIVCFRYVPGGAGRSEPELDRVNRRILLALQDEGEVFISNARVAGRFSLRACIMNHRTGVGDIGFLVERVVAMGNALTRSGKGRRGARRRPG